jgi:hypothetical protein
MEVPIPTLHGGSATFNFTGDTAPIAEYIKAIYAFAVGAVGIVAAVVLMIGGVMWITAGGNASNVGEAKSMITAALTGMVLVLTSYLILGQVNPALVNLSKDIGTVTPITAPAPTPVTTFQTLVKQCDWYTKSSLPTDHTYLSAGNSPDCTKKQTDPNSSCYCYTPAKIDCSWGKDKCASNQIQLTGTDVISSCGSDGFLNNSYCCCKQTAGTCPNCINIPTDKLSVAAGACLSTPCGLYSPLITKLQTLKTRYSQWQITGASPATSANTDACYTDGLCADITPTGDTQILYNSLKGLRPGSFSAFQFNCTESADCCSKNYNYMDSDCQYVNNTIKSYFHVKS